MAIQFVFQNQIQASDKMFFISMLRIWSIGWQRVDYRNSDGRCLKISISSKTDQRHLHIYDIEKQ